MDLIQRTVSFELDGKRFTATFPNVGQMIDMESLKQALTSNRYGVMSASGVQSMYMVLDLVDAMAFFQVCVPMVGKYFDITNYANLQIDEIKKIVEAYVGEIKPWYDNLMKQLYFASGNDETETGDKTER